MGTLTLLWPDSNNTCTLFIFWSFGMLKHPRGTVEEGCKWQPGLKIQVFQTLTIDWETGCHVRIIVLYLFYVMKTWTWQMSMYLFPYEATKLTVVTDFVCSVLSQPCTRSSGFWLFFQIQVFSKINETVSKLIICESK